MTTTYLHALLGGGLIGLSAVLFLLLNGRIAGISGIAASVLHQPSERWAVNLAFVVGLLAGPAVVAAVGGTGLPCILSPRCRSWPSLACSSGSARGSLWLHKRARRLRHRPLFDALAGCRGDVPRHRHGDGRRTEGIVVSNAESRVAAALVCGTVFGAGLALSGMLDPAKVRGFLDIFGPWDPTLAFVLAGAVVVATAGYRIVGRRAAPVLSPRFEMPTRRRIDGALVLGAALFGIGWGLSGYCPGPAVASLGFAGAPALVFVAAMLAGMFAFAFWADRQGRADDAIGIGQRSH